MHEQCGGGGMGYSLGLFRPRALKNRRKDAAQQGVARVLTGFGKPLLFTCYTDGMGYLWYA